MNALATYETVGGPRRREPAPRMIGVPESPGHAARLPHPPKAL